LIVDLFPLFSPVSFSSFASSFLPNPPLPGGSRAEVPPLFLSISVIPLFRLFSERKSPTSRITPSGLGFRFLSPFATKTHVCSRNCRDVCPNSIFLHAPKTASVFLVLVAPALLFPSLNMLNQSFRPFPLLQVDV